MQRLSILQNEYIRRESEDVGCNKFNGYMFRHSCQPLTVIHRISPSVILKFPERRNNRASPCSAEFEVGLAITYQMIVRTQNTGCSACGVERLALAIGGV